MPPQFKFLKFLEHNFFLTNKYIKANSLSTVSLHKFFIMSNKASKATTKNILRGLKSTSEGYLKKLRNFAKERYHLSKNASIPQIIAVMDDVEGVNEQNFYQAIEEVKEADEEFDRRDRKRKRDAEALQARVDRRIRKERLREERLANQQEARNFLSNLFYDDEGEEIRNVVVETPPTLVRQDEFGTTRKFTSQQYQYTNPNHPIGYESLKIMNYHLPFLIQRVRERAVKLDINVTIRFTRDRPGGEDGEVEETSVPMQTRSQMIGKGDINLLKESLEESKTRIRAYISEFVQKGSGWNFDFILSSTARTSPYDPLKGSSYIDLPANLKHKKACINIQNEDDKCLMYCVIYHFRKHEITKNPQRVTMYKPYLNLIDWSSIKFPVEIKDMKKVERLINNPINVYGPEREIYYKSEMESSFPSVNLLLLHEGRKSHYVYICDFAKFVSLKQLTEKDTRRFPCERCQHMFRTRERLEEHLTDCRYFKPQRTILPEATPNAEGKIDLVPYIEFENVRRTEFSPVAVYADFETLIQKTSKFGSHDSSKSSTTTLTDLPACGFAYRVVSEKFPQLEEFSLYRGPDALDRFMDQMTHLDRKILRTLNLSEKAEKYYSTPVFFHNLKSFDGHLIVQAIARQSKPEDIYVIAQNFEKYMMISYGHLKFLDSYAFLSCSLSDLADNLLGYGDKEKENKIPKESLLEGARENFKYSLSNPTHTIEQQTIILSKGIYPYEYFDSFSKFDETQLPPKEEFYSTLCECDISEEDYQHALHTWEVFNIKNLGEYHDLYLETDVNLLADIFESFRKTAHRNYGLDPANGYLTLPNFAWDAMLYMTNVKLEQLYDPNMYMFFERGIRGGISTITHRYAKANNKYMEDFNPSEESFYIMYLDANNLYGVAMVQKLPIKNFRWLPESSLTPEYVMSFDDDGDEGLVLEVDLDYPPELHDLHNDYPLAPESLAIKYDELSPYQKAQLETHNEKHDEKIKKLIPNLRNKRNYVLHIKNLKFYLSQGLVLRAIHRGVIFEQSAWLQPYIDFNTKQRAKSNNEFEKSLYKLMNNAVFGKTMEDMRKRANINLYTKEQTAALQVAKTNFVTQKIYSPSLIAIELLKSEVVLDKPIYAGQTILDLSKLHMAEFHYNYIKPKYGSGSKLCFTDTDSLTYLLKTEDVYKDMKEDGVHFDFSDYKGDGYRSKDNTNKKVLGKMKDETEGVPIREFVGLRSKMYSIKIESGKEKKVGKGIKKSALKRDFRHQNYKNALFSGSQKQNERQLTTFNNFRSSDHKISMLRMTKVGLSCSDDKRYLLDDGITSYAYGHYKTL